MLFSHVVVVVVCFRDHSSGGNCNPWFSGIFWNKSLIWPVGCIEKVVIGMTSSNHL